MRWPYFTPKEILWYLFLLEAEWTPVVMNVDRKIRSLENFQGPHQELSPKLPVLWCTDLTCLLSNTNGNKLPGPISLRYRINWWNRRQVETIEFLWSRNSDLRPREYKPEESQGLYCKFWWKTLGRGTKYMYERTTVIMCNLKWDCKN
jgi:hypothetical protein